MTRFEKKVDKFIWTVIILLPILVYFITNFNNVSSVTFSTFIADFRFNFIYDIFVEIFNEDFIFSDILVSYISYMFSVELIHVFYDFVVFLPRFSHNFLGGCYHEK